MRVFFHFKGSISELPVQHHIKLLRSHNLLREIENAKVRAKDRQNSAFICKCRFSAGITTAKELKLLLCREQLEYSRASYLKITAI